MQRGFLRFQLGYCLARLLVAGLTPEPLIAGYGLVDRLALIAHGARRWNRRERAALSVTESCRGPVDDAGQ